MNPDLLHYITSIFGPEFIIAELVYITILILVALIVDKLVCHFFDHRIRADVAEANSRRATLAKVARSVIHYVIAFIVVVMVLSALGVNVVSIMAAAGVLGLAVSFGAQSLIKDIFAGFFFILEDQFNVGEYVTVNNTFNGFVETLELRSTRLRGDDGELIIIPNGSITDVVNYCRGSLRMKESFEVGYDADLAAASAVIAQAATAYYESHRDDFAVAPYVNGVETIGENGVSLCLITYVEPLKKWVVGRELRQCVVEGLLAAGITIPYPVREIITKEGDHGSDDESKAR